MPGVTGGEGGSTGGGDTGDPRIADLRRVAAAPQRRRDGGGVQGCRLVEGLDASAEVIGEKF
jgi:hypothetical protein